MKANDFFGINLSSPEWLIKETTFGLDEQHIQESLFTLGNGFIGSRGVLEEYPERAMPGTFIAGVYDKSGAQVEELVNLPNPIHFIIAAEGEKLDMHFMGFLRHVRYLDMQKGLLARRTLFKDGKGRKFLYQSLRFFSMSDPHLSYIKISVTLLNGKAELTALDFLDDSVANTGGLIYGKRRHVRLMEADTKENINYYAYRTSTSNIWIAYADYFTIEHSGKPQTVLEDRVYNFKMAAGETVTFTKTLSVCTSKQHHVNRMKEGTRHVVQDAILKGFEQNIEAHINAWKSRWEHSNITICGDALCDKALRFNVYHLLIAGYKGSLPTSIGARALTGQGYRGHVFWDSEIFILPFYIYTDPAIAKNMLLYRYKRLNAARKNAEDKGYKGVLFPWESASSGDDATPRYAKDTDGNVIKMDTMDFEQHISADIAFGVFSYYRATEDIEFMVHQGAEIIFETARFWASRTVFNNKRKKFEILNVTGPDEFHPRVKNNTFTNIMASWNMKYAYDLSHELKEKQPELIKQVIHRVGYDNKEADNWRNICDNIYVSVSKKMGILEQFEGYFKKREANIIGYNSYFMPEAPKHISYEDFNKTKFIKQADTLLLFHLLPARFSNEEKLRNYKYYIKYTLHQSSLSHATHAFLGSELGDRLRAYAFFLFASQVDLKNLHNNSDGGMHMASIGGVWQAAIFGFAGIGYNGKRITINPRLPDHWKSIKFKIFCKGYLLEITVSNKSVELTCYPAESNRQAIEVEICKKLYSVGPFNTIKVKIKDEGALMRRLKNILKEENFIFVKESDSVKDVARLLREKNISSAPVITDNKELCGIISKKDIVDVTEKDDFSEMHAKDIMNKDVEFVKASDHAEIALRIFTERSFQLLPVVKGKTLVGCITRKEILSACSSENY